MFKLGADLQVYLHREPIDFRAGINSLAVLVQETMALDPFAPAAFAFCNRRRDWMKLLFFDRSGFVLVLKRLAEDKFRWLTDDGSWVVSAAGPAFGICPDCRRRTRHRHGWFNRNLRDLPVEGKTVTVKLRLSRWRCAHQKCERQTFTDRLPTIASPYARRNAFIEQPDVQLFQAFDPKAWGQEACGPGRMVSDKPRKSKRGLDTDYAAKPGARSPTALTTWCRSPFALSSRR